MLYDFTGLYIYSLVMVILFRGGRVFLVFLLLSSFWLFSLWSPLGTSFFLLFCKHSLLFYYTIQSIWCRILDKLKISRFRSRRKTEFKFKIRNWFLFFQFRRASISSSSSFSSSWKMTYLKLLLPRQLPTSLILRNRLYSSTATPLPLLQRALLYVPGSDLKKLRKATSNSTAESADAIIFDLEDSVSANEKGSARIKVFDTLQVSRSKQLKIETWTWNAFDEIESQMN